MDNGRELALDVLMEILEKGAYSHLVIREVLDKYNYSENRDKAFVKRTVEGTLERLIQIDYILDRFSSVPVCRMKPLIRNLMRMSVYQLLFMDGIPDSAVCNEAVKLAGKRGFRGLSGFVNGVLRAVARKKETLPYPHREKNEEEYLSIFYSMPRWLVELWLDAYGREKTECILKGLLQEHPVTVRLRENLCERSRDEWLSTLKNAGVDAKEHPYLPYAFWLRHTKGVGNLPGYEEGLFTVQDVSSMLVTEAAGIEKENPQGEMLVLDVCAAPGGKSMHMAEKLAGRGKVIARDLGEYKASLIRDNIERMGYENIEVQVHDARLWEEELREKADVVLADLPCSGLGIMGKKRDIKYRITRDSLRELEALQREILEVIWRYVKPGGLLIYSTCTINPGENDKMMEWFTERYPFVPESLTPFLPKALGGEGEEGRLQLFPGIHETDGFFLARLRRKTEKADEIG